MSRQGVPVTAGQCTLVTYDYDELKVHPYNQSLGRVVRVLLTPACLQIRNVPFRMI